MSYCTTYQVDLSHEKTKLQVFAPASLKNSVEYWTRTSPIIIDENFINFVNTAEHVGIMRSVSGNQPHILKRITSHKKALNAVLSSGLARRHRANPAASLRTEKLHGLPVLLSGVGALTLLKSEIDTLSHHYKQTLEGLLKIHQKTPACFVFFVSGTLPFPAHLHLKQLGLFGMISRLQDNILYKLAKQQLTTCPDNSHSWFIEIKEICQLYQLPHPLSLLESPPTKEAFKHLTKKHVHHYWESKLILEASKLDSLVNFKPQYMSLSTPHPLITSCGSNPYEVNKAVIQLKLLSGRYRSDSLLSNFHPSNPPTCQLSCDQPDAIGDVQHLLINCSALSPRRSILFEYWEKISSSSPIHKEIVQKIRNGPPVQLLQFLLDCSVIPDIRGLADIHGEDFLAPLFKMSRTFCYSIHRTRLKLLNKWRL